MTDPIVIDLRNATPAETEQAFLDIRQHLMAETMFTGPGPDTRDGPIREPGDDVPSWSDVYTADELSAAVSLHAARAGKRGDYEGAAELKHASDALEELAGQIEESRNTVQRLLGEIEDRNLTIRELTSEVRSLRYALTGASEPGDAERIRQAQDDFSADEGEPGTDDL